MLQLGTGTPVVPGINRSRMSTHDNEAERIIALERAALERWGRGDPEGFLEISAEEVVYFDPYVPKRIDGRAALRARFTGTGMLWLNRCSGAVILGGEGA